MDKRVGLGLIVVLCGLMFFGYLWKNRGDSSNRPMGPIIQANAANLPRWGNVSLLGEFLLLETQEGKTQVSILFARKAQKSWIPADLIEDLDVVAAREKSGDKILLGGLYKELDQIGFFALKPKPRNLKAQYWREIIVTDKQRRYVMARSGSDAVFEKAVDAFNNAMK